MTTHRKIRPHRIATLRDGTKVGLYWGRPGAPPDYRGMAPASTALWALHLGQWWTVDQKSAHKAVADLAVCDSRDEAIGLGVVGREPLRVLLTDLVEGEPVA